MNCREEVWNSEGSMLSHEEFERQKQREKLAELPEEKVKRANPTNTKLAQYGLTKKRKEL